MAQDKKVDTQKKLRWQDVLVVGKYYQVKYRYNGKEYNDGGKFSAYEYGNLYFKCDNGEWINVKPFDLISATTS